MRVLLAVVLVGVVGCGGSSPPGGGSVPTPEGSQGKTDKPPAQTANADPVAALKKLGAKIERNEQGEVVEVSLMNRRITDAGLAHLNGLVKLETLTIYFATQITDAGLAHLKGLTQLQSLNLSFTKISDAGLAHLKGLANLKKCNLLGTKITAAGVADLQKALPNCKISK